MTAQIPEQLWIDGETHAMCEEPLAEWYASTGRKPDFAPMHTACWRGYIGEWVLEDGRLFLIGLDGQLGDGRPATVEALFPGSGGRVFAEWFTGRVRVPQGELLAYVHMGYESVHERDLILDLEGGVVVRRAVVHNAGPGSGSC